MEVKFEELQVSDDIMDIVARGVAKIKGLPSPSMDDIVRLEKLTKIYALLMSSLRENIKHNIFSKLENFEHVKDSVEDADDADDAGGELAE
jgi:hypothetical protein